MYTSFILRQNDLSGPRTLEKRVEERTAKLQQSLVKERIHNAIFAMNQIEDIEHIIQLTAQELRAMDLNFEAIGFNISGRCIPASQVGGDFFQYFPLSDNSIAISLADVTGHGMEAAVPVMMFSGILSEFALKIAIG